MLAFLVVLVRLLRWSQDTWREIRKMRQERRKAWKKFLADWVTAWQDRRLTAQTAHNDRLQQSIQQRQIIQNKEHEAELLEREAKHLVRQEKRAEKFKLWSDKLNQKRADVANGTYSQRVMTRWPLRLAISAVTTLFCVAIVIGLPYCVRDKSSRQEETWLQLMMAFVDTATDAVFQSDADPTVSSDPEASPASSVSSAPSSSSDSESSPSPSSSPDPSDDSSAPYVLDPSDKENASASRALIQYFIICVLIISFMGLLLWCIWQLMGRILHVNTGELNLDFINDWDIPVSIFVVLIFLFWMLSINGIKFGPQTVTTWWQFLLLILSLVTVVFVVNEVLLTVIRQCGQPMSLLKQIIYQVVIQLLKLVRDVLISILKILRQQMLSLLALPSSQSDEDKEFDDLMDSKINEEFKREIKKGPTGPGKVRSSKAESKSPNSAGASRKTIWRR